MASTRTPAQALTYVKKMLKDMPLETVDAELLDEINKIMWMAAPWRWTIACLPAIEIDAGPPPVTDYAVEDPPTDFMYIVKAYMTNGEKIRDLKPASILPASGGGISGQPTQICVLPATEDDPLTLRIYPPMSSIKDGETWELVVYYKRNAPQLKKANLNTAGILEIPDEYFWVFSEGTLYKSYFYGDDARSGSATVTSQGQIQYTEQLGIFQAALTQMRQFEPLLLEFDKATPETKRSIG